MSKIILNAPKTTTVYFKRDYPDHPLLANIPMLSDVAGYAVAETVEGQEMRDSAAVPLSAMEASIPQIGLVETIKMAVNPETGRLTKIDGRTRFAAARKAGLVKALAEVVPWEDAETIIRASFSARRTWTQNQKAWFAVLCNPGIAQNKHGGIREKQDDSVILLSADQDDSVILTQRSLAEQAGVDQALIAAACEFYRKFYVNGRPTKAGVEREKSIWLGASIKAVMAGDAGAKASADQPRRPSNYYSVERTFNSLASQSREFDKWAPEERAAMEKRLMELVTPQTFDADGKAIPTMHFELIEMLHEATASAIDLVISRQLLPTDFNNDAAICRAKIQAEKKAARKAEREAEEAALAKATAEMVENASPAEGLLTCPQCGQGGFLKLSAHRCKASKYIESVRHLFPLWLQEPELEPKFKEALEHADIDTLQTALAGILPGYRTASRRASMEGRIKELRNRMELATHEEGAAA